MGVRGLTSLLQREGWLPSGDGNNNSNSRALPTTLWRDASVMSSPVAQHIVPIPPRSTFHMDGNGLAFFLYQVAYARWVEQVTGQASPSASIIRSLTASQVATLIPTFLPLTMLDLVTREFITSLQQHHHMELIVYWDGPGRRFKTVTDKKRQERRILEWHVLQQYCLTGAPPSADVAEWESTFPKDSLFLTQVRHTLRSFTDVEMITCPEEADAEIARRAVTATATSSTTTNQYVVGRDSDFLLMGCAYIPLDTLDASPSSKMVTACVITREELSDHFGLAEPASMIEMAILLGNDYIDRDTMPLQVQVSSKAEAIIDHLRDQGTGYRVTSKSETVEEAMRFVRALYQLEDLSEFPLDTEMLDDKEDEDLVLDEGGDLPILVTGPRPVLPLDLPRSLLQLQPLDKSVLQAVVRCLQCYLDEHSSQELSQVVIQQDHIDALEKLNIGNVPARQPTTLDVVMRPKQWEDVVACYIIERCISYALKSAPDSLLVSISSPSKLFDAMRFFSLLQSMRKSNGGPSSSRKPAAINMTPTAALTEAPPPNIVERVVLPIDEHEEAILKEIKDNRVTIIHGQTGCGKSSRLPCMILKAPPPDPTMKQVKFFISQPRRIAAKALVERIRSCEPDFRDQVALRMGHGVREYESDKTKAWFVTTGYLVRVLANQPDKFRDHTHLIIDEVHERSVDTDILCLLCRRLLHTNSSIRLILMSATLAAELYQQYFNVERPVIEVGARRFPIQQIYVEDLPNMYKLKPKELKAALTIASECERVKCAAAPSQHHMDNMFKLAAHLTMLIGRPGSSVLIFVPGMNEIVAITDLVEKVYVPGVRFTCVPIHSDIPFEDQMMAFVTPEADEVKVIIATNSAESSVTLPDVDHVICLGLCKQIEYNESSHRQILLPCWISRASATQRAGRTGRLRPGFVYRLYTRNTFESYMGEFEPGEMVRIPLDSVILSLKEMLKEEARPILLDCLEPPDISTIDRSFKSLYDSNFITEPDDCGAITTLGSFVNALGVDLTLGSLIGYGIQMGVGPEAIEMAAVLSFPKQPWIMSNPLIHESAEYNDNTSKSFISRCHFDGNTYSEPFAIMNLMWDYEQASDKGWWCRKYNVSFPRIRRLVSTRNSLRSRVAEFVGVDGGSIQVEAPPIKMPPAKLTILRVMQVWLFWDTIMEYSPPDKVSAANDMFNLTLKGKGLQYGHLEQVLDRTRHEFHLRVENMITHKVMNTTVQENLLADREVEQRLLSFATAKEYDLVWLKADNQFRLFVRDRLTQSAGFKSFADREFDDEASWSIFVARPNTSGPRALKERACGTFRFQDTTDKQQIDSAPAFWVVRYFEAAVGKRIIPILQNHTKDNPALERSLSFDILCKQNKRSKPAVVVISRGNCSPINKQDMADLVGIGVTEIDFKQEQAISDTQIVSFPLTRRSPLQNSHAMKKSESSNSLAKANKSIREGEMEGDWTRPFLTNAPEGARLLIVLVSGRRRENIIEFSPLPGEKGTTAKDHAESSPLKVELLPKFLKIVDRWKRMGTGKAVYVGENSVPASVLPVSQQKMQLYCCCANSLEVRGGGLRAEGLTLLPPGRMFLLLSLVTFDLFPLHSTSPMDEEVIVAEAMKWEIEGKVKLSENALLEKAKRLDMAVKFHNSCSNLGDELLCFPNKVRSLCQVFDGLDGFEAGPWESLDDNPFTYDNLELLRHERNLSSPTPLRSRITSATENYPSTPRARNIRDNTPQRKLWSSKKEGSFSAAEGESHQQNLSKFLSPTKYCQTPNKVDSAVDGKPKSLKKKKKGKTNEAKTPPTANSSDEVQLATMTPNTVKNSKRKARRESKKQETSNNQEDRPNVTNDKMTAPGQLPNATLSDAENVAPRTPTNKDQGKASRPSEEIKTPTSKKMPLIAREFTSEDLELYRSLFALDLASTEIISDQEIPTTNLMAILVRTYCDLRLDHDLRLEDRRNYEQQRTITLSASHWLVYTTPADNDGKVWYFAEFVNTAIPLLHLNGRKKKDLPRFMKRNHARPVSKKQALQCFPKNFAETLVLQEICAKIGNGLPPMDVLVFESLDMALRAEAAFWLERQFRTSKKHWYGQKLEEMVGKLKDYDTLQKKAALEKPRQSADTLSRQVEASAATNGASLSNGRAPPHQSNDAVQPMETSNITDYPSLIAAYTANKGNTTKAMNQPFAFNFANDQIASPMAFASNQSTGYVEDDDVDGL